MLCSECLFPVCTEKELQAHGIEDDEEQKLLSDLKVKVGTHYLLCSSIRTVPFARHGWF